MNTRANAEASLIHGILQAPNRYAEASRIVSESDFFSDDYRLMWSALVAAQGSTGRLTASGLVARLVEGGMHEKVATVKVEGLPLLADFGGAHVMHSAETVRHYGARDQARIMAQNLAALAENPPAELDSLHDSLAEIGSQVHSLTLGGKNEVGGLGIAEALEVAIQRMTSPSTPGLRTGFYKLDEHLRGMRGGQLIVVGARPAVGKSAFALNLALSMDGEHQEVINGRQPRGLMVSLEMDETELLERLVTITTGYSWTRIKTGGTDVNDALDDARKRLKALPLLLLCPSRASLSTIAAQARHLAESEEGLDYICIDYLQRLRGDGKKDRYREVAETSAGLKALARELEVPIVVLAQVGRQAGLMRPALHHLRESGDIEADADVVLLLHRSGQYEEVLEEVTKNGKTFLQGTGEYQPTPEKDTILEIEIAKNRRGSTGRATMEWRGPTTQLLNRNESTTEIL